MLNHLMMKNILFVCLLLCMFHSAGALASGRVILHDGYTIDYGCGGSGPVIVTPYVNYPASLMKMYTGNQITSVRIGLAANAQNVTLYFKHADTDARAMVTQKVGALKQGWNEVTLTEPIILDGQPLAIGYKASFVKGESNGVGCSYEQSQGTARVFYNSKSEWQNVQGSMCIQAVVEGDSLPHDALRLRLLSSPSFTYADSARITLEVRNMGGNAITSYAIAATHNGMAARLQYHSHSIAVDGRDTLELAVPLDLYDNTWVLRAASVNDVADTWPAGIADSTQTARHDTTYMNRVLVEEGTGNWCKFCVEGIVRMDLMKQQYGNLFVPVCMHSDDPMHTADCDSLLSRIDAYPEALVNREYVCNDVFGSLEQYCKYYMSQYGTFGLKLRGTYNADSSAVDVTTTYISKSALSGSPYALSFIVLEDSVTDYQQFNGYAGGSSGSFYGWEKLPSEVDWAYDDVARALPLGVTGVKFMPQQVSAGQYYNYKLSVPLPSSVTRPAKVHLVAVVTNTATGKVVNCCDLRPQGGVSEGILRVANTHAAQLIRHNGNLEVACQGRFRVSVNTLDGKCLYSAVGTNELTLPQTAPNALVIVSVAPAGAPACHFKTVM